MANNMYGIVRPALVNVEQDVEIYYHYKPSRGSEDLDFKSFKKIDNVSNVFKSSTFSVDVDNIDNRLSGMYDLNLPLNIFSKKGIYTIYIRPREYKFNIKDVGNLLSYPDIKGIVIDINENAKYRHLFKNDNLIGYRVEYYEFSNGKLERKDYYRIITSNNTAEIIPTKVNNVNSDLSSYRFSHSSNLCFITLTPSTSPSYKSNLKPFIGVPNQQIVISNTKFDPVMLEVEIVDHDIETLSIMLEGEQVRNLENGRVTTYNFNGEIYNQFEYSTIKDNYNTNSIIEAKLRKDNNIDYSVDLSEIKKLK